MSDNDSNETIYSETELLNLCYYCNCNLDLETDVFVDAIPDEFQYLCLACFNEQFRLRSGESVF